MATRAVTTREPQGGAEVVTWENITTTDNVGAWASLPGPPGAIQVTGNFGTGGTLILEGSNDASIAVALNDLQDGAISFTAAGGAQVQEHFAFYRPRLSAGTGAVDLDVKLAGRRG